MGIFRRAAALALSISALLLVWTAVPAHADEGCPWRVIPAGGSLWQQAPWWPYLVGGLCVLGGLVLGILFFKRRKRDEEQPVVDDKADAPEPDASASS